MAISTNNEKLAVLDWTELEPGLPLSPGAFGQGDKQQLLWGYPGVAWGAAAVTDNTKLANLEWCNLLEPGLPVSSDGLDQADKQQLLWGYPDVVWGSISTPDIPGASGVRRRKDRQQYRYPRKIRIGDAWVLVRSFEEERSALLRYRDKLEEKVSESKLPSQRAVAKQRLVYTTKRLAKVITERDRVRARIIRADNELIIALS